MVRCIRCRKYLTEAEEAAAAKTEEDGADDGGICNACYEFENRGAGDDE